MSAMMTREEQAQQIRLLREGHGREREEAVRKLSTADDDETLSILVEALGKAVEDASTEMEVHGDLSDKSRREAEGIATVLAYIGSPRAFAALCEAWKTGLRTIDPQIRKFGRIGSKFLRPRTLVDRLLGRRKWAPERQHT